MKQLFSLLLLSFSLASLTQAVNAQAPTGYKPGYIIHADGTRQEGFIKESFKSKASLQFQSSDGKKSILNGDAVKEAGIEGTVYITYLSDFFKVIHEGAKASLYQKVSDASGKVIYSGTDVVGINPGTEGSINDHFIRTSAGTGPVLITRKNFAEMFSTHCADCPAVVEGVKTNKFTFEEIEKAVRVYNDCI
jgi:hypothetical protein